MLYSENTKEPTIEISLKKVAYSFYLLLISQCEKERNLYVASRSQSVVANMACMSATV